MISTPKKVALAVLGTLTLLTIVNLIQAGVQKNSKARDMVVQFEKEFTFHHNGSRGEHVVVHVEKRHASPEETELMLEESYKVSAGENLSVAVGDADINVETNQGSEAKVEIYLEGRDMERARAYFEDQNFEISRDGSTIHVVTHPARRNYSWDRDGGANINVAVTIPSDFNVSLKTSDGDIAMGKINGEVTILTSDGDISTDALFGPRINLRTSDGDIAGQTFKAERVSIVTSDGDIALDDVNSDEISIKTSDGDIKAGQLTGNASVSTSDGDIVIMTLEGDEVAVRTSDGEILAHEVRAKRSQFQTSDGSIMLKKVMGELTAKTSSGDLNVTLDNAEKVYLQTGDGDIHIRAPQDYSAELFLKGERVRISSGFQFDGTLKENEAEGRINGGGHSIEARTSDGEIVFREN